MGSIGNSVNSLFGGAPNNADYQAQRTNILQPTTTGQAQQLYGQAQAGLDQQQALAQALAAQGGLGNQANVFGQQQALANQMAQNNGLAAQQAALQGYQGIANGTGPNVAQSMLNQATGQNVANQAALMAGQRGAGANAGLMARQVGQQGAATQQQAAGQGALLEAQQQQAALGQMAGIGGQQAGQLQGQQAAMGNMANQQVANQIGGVGAYNQVTQGLQGNVLNAINAQNSANIGMQGNMNQANAAMSQTNANNTANFFGGLAQGVGAMFMPKGGAAAAGAVAKAYGGMIEESEIPQHVKHIGSLYHPEHFALGGQVQNPNGYQAVDQGSMFTPNSGAGKFDLENKSDGGAVEGKAKVKGDSYKNDSVPTMLSPGEIVIPRSVLQGENPVEEAAKFVESILKKHKSMGSQSEHDEFKEALKSAIKGRKH